jgi:hypothetical protein
MAWGLDVVVVRQGRVSLTVLLSVLLSHTVASWATDESVTG